MRSGSAATTLRCWCVDMSDWEERRQELLECCSALNIRFNDLTLLDCALTHASVAAEEEGAVQNYESLEFLGDAVLGMAVAEHLYTSMPESSPGDKTQIRAQVVNKTTLASVARDLQLGQFIWLGRGEETSGGRDRDALLADCLEAVIGGLYLDGEWDAAREFVIRILDAALSKAGGVDSNLDYRSRLQNECQARKVAIPEYRVIRSSGPDHAKSFEVAVFIEGEKRGFGTGSTKKEAEQQAACDALSKDDTI